MVSQYPPPRPKESGLTRTVFRLALVFIIAFLVFQGYPYVRAYWSGGGTSTGEGSVLQEARNKLESGDADAAAALLDESIAREQEPEKRFALIRQRVDIARKNDNWTLAGELLQHALTEFSDRSEYPALAVEYGEALEKQGRIQEAQKQYEDVLKTAPKGMHAPALMGMGRIAELGQSLVEARDQYRAALNDAPVDSELWKQALDAMGALNATLIFAQQETPESKYYTVESGDTLTSIGIKLNTTQGLLARANGIEDTSKLHLGQRLKYTPKDFRIVVERSTCRLFLMDNQGPFKCYGAGLGMPGYETTLGKYTIGSKQKDPTWFQPNGPPIPPNDPQNELGTRWMPMVPVEEGLPTDLGIHGTIAPETIGHYKSHGCPRLLNANAEELYDLVVRSTPVEVVEVIDWGAGGGQSTASG